jgi:hypothetical protein
LAVKVRLFIGCARRFAVLLIAGAVAAPHLGAMGSREKKEEARNVDVFLLAENRGESGKLASEKMDLPSSIALFQGVRFDVRGDRVSTEADSVYSSFSKTFVSERRADGVMVLGYRVKARFPVTAPRAIARALYVSFGVKDCLGGKGGVLFQPARLALIRAATASGIGSGSARISSLSYRGEGRFIAKVELWD